MAEIVLVLGAGASVQSGAPMMTNFLDIAENIWLAGKAQGDNACFERVFRSIAALKAVNAELTIDTYNLEAVFSAFEMGAMVGRLGALTDNDVIGATRSAMGRLIARTLQETVKLPWGERLVRPPSSYEAFVDLLHRILNRHRRSNSPKATAVITLNYDLGLDYALQFARIRCDYALAATELQALPLLKLHGSLNWALCSHCRKIVPWHLDDYLRNHQWNTMLADRQDVLFTLAIADHLHELHHCGSPLPDEPFVVPPTWNKGDSDALRNVWRAAANELSDARFVAFIGYSFPETDLYFRYLLAMGMTGDTRVRRIIVQNPDVQAKTRLEGMLSPNLRSRLTYLPTTFESGLGRLSAALELEDR